MTCKSSSGNDGSPNLDHNFFARFLRVLAFRYPERFESKITSIYYMSILGLSFPCVNIRLRPNMFVYK